MEARVKMSVWPTRDLFRNKARKNGSHVYTMYGRMLRQEEPPKVEDNLGYTVAGQPELQHKNK